MKGTITRLFLTRGFGFLKGEDGVERFVHITNLQNGTDWEAMKPGMTVYFEPIEGKKGPRAGQIRNNNG